MNYTLIATVVSLLPLYFIKKYISTKDPFLIIVTLSLYAILTWAYVNLFSKGEISNLYTNLQVIQILVVVLGGVFIFHEEPKYVGILFGLLAIYFLNKK
jgi:hypothetical protein